MPVVLDFTKPHVLRTEEEYDAAIERLRVLSRLDPAEGSDEWEEFRFLSLLVQEFERENFEPIEASPQEVVEVLLEEHGLDRSAIYDVMGGRSRVSEFLSGKRSLSMNQLTSLAEFFGVPADVFLE